MSSFKAPTRRRHKPQLVSESQPGGPEGRTPMAGIASQTPVTELAAPGARTSLVAGCPADNIDHPMHAPGRMIWPATQLPRSLLAIQPQISTGSPLPAKGIRFAKTDEAALTCFYTKRTLCEWLRISIRTWDRATAAGLTPAPDLVCGSVQVVTQHNREVAANQATTPSPDGRSTWQVNEFRLVHPT